MLSCCDSIISTIVSFICFNCSSITANLNALNMHIYKFKHTRGYGIYDLLYSEMSSSNTSSKRVHPPAPLVLGRQRWQLSVHAVPSPPTYYHHGYYHTHSHVEDDPDPVLGASYTSCAGVVFSRGVCLLAGAERDVTPQGPAPAIEFAMQRVRKV